MALERLLIRPIADVRELEPLTDIAELSAIDYALAIDIGTVSATAINIGRVGFLTTILGDLQVDGTTTLISTSTLEGDVNIGDGGNTITIGGDGVAGAGDVIYLGTESTGIGSDSDVTLRTLMLVDGSVYDGRITGDDATFNFSDAGCGVILPNVGSGAAVALDGSIIIDGSDLKWYDGAAWITAAVLGGVTLDFAYDGGGLGAGRIITCDQGAVEITGSNAGDYSLEVTNSAAGGVLYINNTGTGLTLNIQDGGANVFNIADDKAFDINSAAFDLNATGNITINSDTTIDIDAVGTIDIDSSTGTIGIGTVNIDQNINIGTGGERSIQIGNNNANTRVDIDAGAGGAVDIDANSANIELSTLTTGNIRLVSAGDIGITADDDSSWGVIVAAKSLNIGVSGGGAQKLGLSSEGTGTDALSMLASAGGITLKSSTSGTKSADIALDTVSADSTIIIGTTHGVGGQDSLVGIFANNSAAGAGNDATVAIYPHTSGGGGGTARLYLGRDKAGVLNSHYVFIKATHGIALSTTGTGDITIAAADDVSISSADDVTVSATDTLLLASTTEDVDINAATAVTINAAITSNFTVTGAAQDLVLEVVGNGTLDLNAATGAITLDAGLGISLDAVDVSNFTMSAGGDGARLTIETQGAGNQGIVISSAGNVADSIAVNATAGGIEVDALLDVAINSSTGSILIGNDAVAQPIGIGTGAAARTITIGNATANTQVNLDSGAGGKIDLDADQGNIEISTHTSGNIRLSSDGDVGISAAEDSSFSVPVAGKDLNFSVSGGGVQVIGLSSEGTGTDAVNLVATAGGIEVDALGAIAINSSGSTLNIGNDADAFGINIGTGAAARTITVGNVTLATAVNLIAGTGGITFDAHGAAAPIPINSAAAPDLAGFVAPSIVGALNELKAGPIWMNGIVVNANAYTVNAGDEYAILHVTYTATGACTITINTAWIAVDYNTIIIKDTGRNALINNITIVTEGAELFEGNAIGGIMKSVGACWAIQAYNGNLYMIT